MTSGKATSETNEDDMALVQGLCAAEEVQSAHAQWQANASMKMVL